ncbi:MAG: hypothetical protein WD431_25510 [Cyclobacteriaceae bacterium]
MKNALLYIRSQVSLVILIIFSLMQWSCMEVMEPRESRINQPLEKPRIIYPKPGKRKSVPVQTSKYDPTEKSIRE